MNCYVSVNWITEKRNAAHNRSLRWVSVLFDGLNVMMGDSAIALNKRFVCFTIVATSFFFREPYHVYSINAYCCIEKQEKSVRLISRFVIIISVFFFSFNSAAMLRTLGYSRVVVNFDYDLSVLGFHSLFTFFFSSLYLITCFSTHTFTHTKWIWMRHTIERFIFLR